MANILEFEQHVVSNLFVKIEPVNSRIVFGMEGVRRLQALGWLGISHDMIAGYMPEDAMWKKPEYVTDPENPHNKPHSYRVAIGACIIAAIEYRGNEEAMPKVVPMLLDMLRYHDIRQGRKNNNPMHGLEAATLFLDDPAMKVKYSSVEMQDMAYMIEHHSDRRDPDGYPRFEQIKKIFHILQDADACELRRRPLKRPFLEIYLHSDAAREILLPDILRLLQDASDIFHDDDIMIRHRRAAIMLGLVHYES